jgi:hypothetical protein
MIIGPDILGFVFGFLCCIGCHDIDTAHTEQVITTDTSVFPIVPLCTENHIVITGSDTQIPIAVGVPIKQCIELPKTSREITYFFIDNN